jgi:hypothetical protein
VELHSLSKGKSELVFEQALNLQRFALLFSFAVEFAIIVAAVALRFIASHTAALRNELLKLRVSSEMATERKRN